MKKKGYGLLVAKIYRLSRKDERVLVDTFPESFLPLLDQALEKLADERQGGQRMVGFVRSYYGLGCEPMTYAAIAASLEKPLATQTVSHIVLVATHKLTRDRNLRPVVKYLVAQGYENNSSYFGLAELLERWPTPEQEASLAASLKKPPTNGTFLLDCLPGCSVEQPCPSCRAKKLLRTESPFLDDEVLLDELLTLAKAWRDGDGEHGDWRCIGIDVFDLSVRSSNCLRNANIMNLGQLCQKSEAEMLRTPNFGRKQLNEIKEAMAQFGLAFSTS